MKNGAWLTIGAMVAIILGAGLGVNTGLTDILEGEFPESMEPILDIIWGIPVIIGGVFALRSKVWRPFTSAKRETWIGRIGGILTILSGLGGLAAGSGFIEETMIEPTIVGYIVIALSLVAIIGGVFALRRKNWILALTGSICSIVVMPFGIAAHILIVLGRGVFIRE